jgi:hypothetical protein
LAILVAVILMYIRRMTREVGEGRGEPAAALRTSAQRMSGGGD